MNTKMFMTALALLIVGALSIATSSMAIDCYNADEKYKADKQTNFNFIIFNLVSAIIMTLIGFSSIYLAIKG